MKLAKVAGTVVATIKAPIFEHQRVLLCDYISSGGAVTGDYVIAVDTVDAGVGDTVLILDEGTGARQIMEVPIAPIRALIVGIVDETDIPELP